MNKVVQFVQQHKDKLSTKEGRDFIKNMGKKELEEAMRNIAVATELEAIAEKSNDDIFKGKILKVSLKR